MAFWQRQDGMIVTSCFSRGGFFYSSGFLANYCCVYLFFLYISRRMQSCRLWREIPVLDWRSISARFYQYKKKTYSFHSNIQPLTREAIELSPPYSQSRGMNIIVLHELLEEHQ